MSASASGAAAPDIVDQTRDSLAVAHNLGPVDAQDDVTLPHARILGNLDAGSGYQSDPFIGLQTDHNQNQAYIVGRNEGSVLRTCFQYTYCERGAMQKSIEPPQLTFELDMPFFMHDTFSSVSLKGLRLRRAA